MVAGGRDREAVDYPRCEAMAFDGPGLRNREAGNIPEGCQKVAGGRDREAVDYPRCEAMALFVCC